MSFLISNDWVLREAQQLGVQVPESKLRHAFDHLRREAFPKRGEFSAFLKKTGETVADLLLRVQVSLLSVKIEGRLAAGQAGLESFPANWRAQTDCVAAFAVQDCGTVQASL